MTTVTVKNIVPTDPIPADVHAYVYIIQVKFAQNNLHAVANIPESKIIISLSIEIDTLFP